MKKIQLGFSRLVAAAIALFAASASLWADDVVAKAGEVITVSDPQPGVEYVAREGVVQFGDVSAEGLGSVVGRWEFDDPSNPGKDSGLVGNDLAVSNSVAVVDDEVRGKVAEFGADSCLFGMGPDRSIKQMPTGIDVVSDQHSAVRKMMIDGILYIVKEGKIFDAQGKRLQ